MKIHPLYNNRILYNILGRDLKEFIHYIDKKHHWKFGPYISDINYNKEEDIIHLIDRRNNEKDNLISINKDDLLNIRYERDEYDGDGIDEINYKNKIFYII